MSRPTSRVGPAVMALACLTGLTLLTVAGVWLGVRVLDAGLFVLSCLLNAL